jgi:hypothetical protein
MFTHCRAAGKFIRRFFREEPFADQQPLIGSTPGYAGVAIQFPCVLERLSPQGTKGEREAADHSSQANREVQRKNAELF